jgi:N-acylglucosamine 2-epimerase
MSAKVGDESGRLAGRSLEELREEYRYWLFDDYLPFLDRHVVDHELGGFMCAADRDGTQVNSNKRTWYEGRGIWVASFLHNKVGADEHQVEIARKSVEFIGRHDPTGPELLPVGYTREGAPLKDEPDPIFYGDMFVANGLQEFSEAVDEPRYWEMAKAIVRKCLDIYDNRPDYGSQPATDGLPPLERPRMLGHWFVLLRCTTQMLEKRDDADLLAINDRCIEAVMEHHLNPEHGLVAEYTNHDLSRIDNDWGQKVTGHAPETMWMVLFEALRRGDRELFDRAAAVFRRHLEVMWDDVYGGLLASLEHVERNEWRTQKHLWLQEEALIGTLCVAEHTGAEWAKEWFARMYDYVLETFPLKEHGYPLWILTADREVTFEEHTSRVGNFHHPRHLMVNLLALDRMIARKGELSGHFG